MARFPSDHVPPTGFTKPAAVPSSGWRHDLFPLVATGTPESRDVYNQIIAAWFSYARCRFLQQRQHAAKRGADKPQRQSNQPQQFSNSIVDLEIYDASRKNVLHKFIDGQSRMAGQIAAR